MQEVTANGAGRGKSCPELGSAESPEQGPSPRVALRAPALGRKGKLRAETNSEKQGCVVVSCHKC